MAGLPAETGGLGGQASAFQGFAGLNVLRQIGLMIGLAFSVAVGVAVVMWFWDEDYLPLYQNLDRMNPDDVINVLQSNEIIFKIDEKSGALLVASDQIHQARLKLAGAGISPDGAFGFELLDKEQPLGTSQFMENARLKRSLEGELARTIASIRAVRGARVHLALPKPSTFVRDAREPSASVFVDLFSGSGLNKEQVRAIANLVASSVPQLKLENVTVVDQRGNLLSDFVEDADMVLANRQREYTRALELDYVKRINSLLEPLLGSERFRAEVSADLDFTEVEQTDEVFNPDLPALRSEQSLEEQRSGAGPGGIPGALSNQPPDAAAAPETVTATSGAAAAPVANNRKQATRNFELDRTVSYTRHQVGKLQRLTVAVVVDHAAASAEGAEATPLPAEELERLTTLVRDAVGYDEGRGDSVNVVNSRFLPKEPEGELTVEETPIWEQDWVLRYAKLAGGLLVISVMIFGVLRPVLRSLSETSKEMREMEAQRALGEMGGDLGLGGSAVTLSGGDSLMLPGPNESYEAQLNAIKGLVAEDPGRVAQVVRKWVAASD